MLASAVLAPIARAQTPQELDDARRLFTEALADEQEKRFDVALGKLRRVQAVRDTVSIRYRIAACLEGLGRLREARAAFAAIGDGAAQAAGDDAETARSAAARAADLDGRIPTLALRLSARASGAEVRVDGQPVALEALAQPLALDPGEHVVDATASGASPFRSRVTLAERARVELTVPLDPIAAPPPSASVVAPPPEDGTKRTWGVVALAGGGVLVSASVVTLLLRNSDIAELNRSCPGGTCAASREAELTSLRHRALLEGPLGAAFGIAGVAAAGVGLYLMLSPNGGPAPARGGMSVFVGADGIVRLRGTF